MKAPEVQVKFPQLTSIIQTLSKVLKKKKPKIETMKTKSCSVNRSGST